MFPLEPRKRTYFIFLFNLTYRRLLTSKVWMDDSTLIQESNLTARQPRRSPYHVVYVKGLPTVPTWRLEGGIRTCNHPDARHRIYHRATTPLAWWLLYPRL